MGKYAPFARYLRERGKTEIELSFAEIERILGAKLPGSAFRHRQWWSNNPANSALTAIWLGAGYRTQAVDMERRRLRFRRLPEGEATPAVDRVAVFREHMSELSALLWVDPDYDFTQPPDPGLADAIERRFGPEVKRVGR